MVQPILGDKFSSDTVGVRYDIAGGLRIGLLHSSYDFTDAGNAAQTTMVQQLAWKSGSISKLFKYEKGGATPPFLLPKFIVYCTNGHLDNPFRRLQWRYR